MGAAGASHRMISISLVKGNGTSAKVRETIKATRPALQWSTSKETPSPMATKNTSEQITGTRATHCGSPAVACRE
ncbi:hypothetical protein GCM10009583_00320 [Ornithinicoccus hortensis]